jgi:hypothetical protein
VADYAAALDALALALAARLGAKAPGGTAAAAAAGGGAMSAERVAGLLADLTERYRFRGA